MSSNRGAMAAAREQAPMQDVVVTTSPSRPLEEFAGGYEHPAYDVLEVSVADGELRAAWHDVEGVSVQHRTGDVWDLVVPGYDMALTLLHARTASLFAVAGRSGVSARFHGEAAAPATRVVLTSCGVFERVPDA